MVLGRIFGSMREELTGEWRELHNELHCVFCLKTIWMIKSEVMSWTCEVIGDDGYVYNSSV